MNINLKNVPKEGEKEDHYIPFITKNISNQNELSIFASKYRKIIHPRERESINQKIVPKEEEKRIIISFGHGGSGHSQLTSEGANCR